VPKPPIRKVKKKVCQFCKDKATYVDYKDTTLLRKFISEDPCPPRQRQLQPAPA
jgi:small subunit ribosomal protein S18